MPEKQLMAVTGDEMGLAALPKGARPAEPDNAPAVPRVHHSPAQRGSALCPALAVSPAGTCHPPVLQHWVLHWLQWVLESPGWRGRLSVLLPAPSSSQVSCWGEGSSELSHPSQRWVPTLEPRNKREKRTS